MTRGSAQSKAIGKQALYAQIDRDQRAAYDYAIEHGRLRFDGNLECHKSS